MSTYEFPTAKNIPWTRSDEMLTLWLKGSPTYLEVGHPNFERILEYLKAKKFGVVEALIYRQEGSLSLEAQMQKSSPKEINGDMVLTAPLPTFPVAPVVVVPGTGRISTVIIDTLANKAEVVNRLYILMKKAHRDAFAYQSIEEKFPGDLKISTEGVVSEYRLKEENWVPICLVVEFDHPKD